MSHTIAPNSLPVFDGYNYTFWKIHMRAYLKSIDVWHIVESGWINPNNASAEFSKDEKIASSANDKALHAIYSSMCPEEFERISRCVIAKEAWETLEITHEGFQIVKASKIHMLVSKFEEIRMEEEETFDEFYYKLSTIRNCTINLGKKMTDAKIVKKILRSLPPRFIPQVATITQSQDLETMRVEELVGSLQTFELLLPKPRNSKNLALKIKTTEGKSVDFFYEEFGDDEEIPMMARKFKKFLRNNGNSKSREPKNYVNPRHEVKCYACGGVGHIRADCENLIKSKGKAFDATQSDESDQEEKAENVANYVAFGVSYNSQDDASESKSLDSDYGICDNESEEESDLQEAYNHLFSKYGKVKKLNKEHLQKLKEVSLGKDKLSSTLTDSHKLNKQQFRRDLQWKIEGFGL
jgi:hypothetical protein